MLKRLERSKRGIRHVALLIFLGPLLLGPMVEGSAEADALPACTAQTPASLSVSKDTNTRFTLGHQAKAVDDYIEVTYGGCQLPANALISVDVIAADGQADAFMASLSDKGNGVAFIHLYASSHRLRDGTQTVQLIIHGDDVATSVLPVTIEHQYRTWSLAVLFSLAGWIIGLIVASVHGDLASSQSLKVKKIFGGLIKYWWASILTLGGAYGAYLSAYENNDSFAGGLVSLVGLATKVGAASAAAFVVTSTAGVAAGGLVKSMR